MMMKNLLAKVLLTGVGLAAATSTPTASADVYSSLIGNPFVFCSAPRPCKHCQPFRKIYTQICDSQSDASKNAELAETAQELAARNAALTAAKIAAAQQEGADALIAALQRGDATFSLDGNTDDLTFNAYAFGWNSELMRQSTGSSGSGPASNHNENIR
jgi:hypothetical protein